MEFNARTSQLAQAVSRNRKDSVKISCTRIVIRLSTGIEWSVTSETSHGPTPSKKLQEYVDNFSSHQQNMLNFPLIPHNGKILS